MNISLTPELEGFVQKKVSSGLYNSASEVVRAALRLMIEQEKTRQQQIAEFQAGVELGLKDLAEGRSAPWDEVYQEMKEMVDKALKEKSKEKKHE